MIDRIESHPKLGLRIIDFKTKKKPTLVSDAHLKKLGRNESPEDFPSWAIVNHNGKDHRWINLQVPIYLLALRELHPHRELTAGYVALFKDILFGDPELAVNPTFLEQTKTSNP